AWTSDQSRVIESREVLEERFRRLSSEYKDRIIPLPPNWGGYRVKPQVFEFWQERPARLHDRIRYRQDGGLWIIERLAP
ncbi:MAG: pyridoxine 5'-phosphate oxidase C-terminal domain-containing protein, partial [Blastocatellia bacterium]